MGCAAVSFHHLIRLCGVRKVRLPRSPKEAAPESTLCSSNTPLTTQCTQSGSTSPQRTCSCRLRPWAATTLTLKRARRESPQSTKKVSKMVSRNMRKPSAKAQAAGAIPNEICRVPCQHSWARWVVEDGRTKYTRLAREPGSWPIKELSFLQRSTLPSIKSKNSPNGMETIARYSWLRLPALPGRWRRDEKMLIAPQKPGYRIDIIGECVIYEGEARTIQ